VTQTGLHIYLSSVIFSVVHRHMDDSSLSLTEGSRFSNFEPDLMRTGDQVSPASTASSDKGRLGSGCLQERRPISATSILHRLYIGKYLHYIDPHRQMSTLYSPISANAHMYIGLYWQMSTCT
jgi:hypothetical protein